MLPLALLHRQNTGHKLVERLVGKVVRFQHRGIHWWAAPLNQKQRNRAEINNWLALSYTWRLKLCILLKVKLEVSFCWLPPLPTPYLDGVSRRHSMRALGKTLSSPLPPKSNIGCLFLVRLCRKCKCTGIPDTFRQKSRCTEITHYRFAKGLYATFWRLYLANVVWMKIRRHQNTKFIIRNICSFVGCVSFVRSLSL